MPTARLFHIDAFTGAPFAGNPAMVCLLPEGPPADARWMAALAADVNLSETVYLRPTADDPDHDFEIRWFTPKREVDLCGHATLASAHALYTAGVSSPSNPIRLRSNSGTLTVTAEPGGHLIWMDFPSTPALAVRSEQRRARALGALGLGSANFIGETSSGDLLIEADSPATVADLEPDFRALGEIPATRGFAVTARTRGGKGAPDFVSRFFAPACGIDEDPVTGSAHCALAPFWAERIGEDDLLAQQVSARGGTVRCRVVDGRTHLGGEAVTIYEATVPLPTGRQPVDV